MLTKLAQDLSRDVPVTTAVESGTPAPHIAEYARRHGIDLIVVGTHGRTGVSRVLLGSVAEHVVRIAPCPVLAVPGVGAAPTIETERLDLHRCVVCAKTPPDFVCETCRDRLRRDAVERKQRQERAGRV
jgi:hypothetical protein